MKFEISNSVGLHARPAALFVQAAQGFESEITVKNGNKQGNAKSLLSILSLGVGKGTEILVEAHGSDAHEALQSIKDLIENNFGEEL